MQTGKNLSERIYLKQPLTKEEKRDLCRILGKRCARKTRDLLEIVLNTVPCVEDFGIYRRVELDGDGASYCAGQDYPGEIALIRSLLLKKYRETVR